MLDEALLAFRTVGLDFWFHYDMAFYHGIFLKTRRMFLLGYVVDHPGRGRTFIVFWLSLRPPATVRDVCDAVRAEFGRDEPEWVAFGRGLKYPNKDLSFFRPRDIERVCAAVSPHR